MGKIYGLPSNQPNPNTFTKEKFVALIPRYKTFVEGDGSALYDMFFEIANQKILFNVWNSDWEFAMSYCISHYLDITNRETQKSFGLDDIALDSGPKGIVVEMDKTKYSLSETTLEHRYSKFWNLTHYGRTLILLLETKGIPTMLVAN